MNGISVIVCCYNSALRIRPTLEHLSKQVGLESDEWEIIVVDNASTDNTSYVANEVWNEIKSNQSPHFIVVQECTPGLSSARHTGISISKYDYVLFCDDDNWLCSDYLATGLQIMNDDRDIGVLGGMGEPVFENQEPPFFWENQYHALAVGEQYKIEGDITNTRSVVYGAGMILHKAKYNLLLSDFDFEFQASDRVGNSLVSCGDHELCLALKMIGCKIYWSKKLTFKHYMPASRTTIKYYIRLFTGYGMSIPLLQGYNLNGSNLNTLKNDYRYIVLRSIKNISKDGLMIFIKGFFWSNNKYQYLSLLQHLYSNIGILSMTLKIKNRNIENWKAIKIFNYKAAI